MMFSHGVPKNGHLAVPGIGITKHVPSGHAETCGYLFDPFCRCDLGKFHHDLTDRPSPIDDG